MDLYFTDLPKRKLLDSEENLATKRIRPNDDKTESLENPYDNGTGSGQKVQDFDIFDNFQGSPDSRYLNLETFLESQDSQDSSSSEDTDTEGNPKPLDPRIEKHTLVWDDKSGQYMVPRSCKPYGPIQFLLSLQFANYLSWAEKLLTRQTILQ